MSKNRLRFIMLGGLPASGKSTFAKNYVEQVDKTCCIVSSDATRKELWGDESVQGDTKILFEKIYEKIIGHLSRNESVIFDATNLSRKHRLSVLSLIKQFDVEKQYILLATATSICKERNKVRERIVPNHVYDSMIKGFNVPLKSEGWDFIDIHYEVIPSTYSVLNYMNSIAGYNQENPHHTQDLLGHVLSVQSNVVAEMPAEPVIKYAALFHDCGKPYTKVYHTMKGVPTEHAHYYGHDNYGAWESIFYAEELFTTVSQILDVATLVEFHMRPYFAKTEKARNKIKNLLGEDLYYMLEILHKADVESH